MYNIALTHDRAMGNAYAVYTPSNGIDCRKKQGHAIPKNTYIIKSL